MTLPVRRPQVLPTNLYKKKRKKKCLIKLKTFDISTMSAIGTSSNSLAAPSIERFISMLHQRTAAGTSSNSLAEPSSRTFCKLIIFVERQPSI